MTRPKSINPEAHDKLERYTRLGHDEQRAHLLATVEALLVNGLKRGELLDVLNEMADRLRLDADGNPIEKRHGLYEAFFASLLGLLDPPEAFTHRALIRRLQQVALGAKLAGNQERAILLHELQSHAEGFLSASRAGRWTLDEASKILTKTLSKRHGKEIAVSDVAKALARRTISGQVTELEALVSEPYKHKPGSKAYSDERDRRLRTVKRTLKRH